MSNKVINKSLSTKRYYQESSQVDVKKYRLAQVDRWNEKRFKQRNSLTYKSASNVINQNIQISSNTAMLCLGTRNNFERDQFRSNLRHHNVFSLDIAKDSGSDYIADFNKLKFDTDLDIIFSNAIDHCIQPNKSYLNWLNCLKPSGLMIIDFCLGDDSLLNEHDCASFSKESISNFLNELEELNLVKIVYGPKACSETGPPSWGKEYTGGYIRTAVKRVTNE